MRLILHDALGYIRTFFVCVALSSALGMAENLTKKGIHPWKLPLELSKETTTVSFELDSTWHMINGEAQAVSGNIWQSDPNNNDSVHALVKIGVADLVTGNTTRDKKMRSVMHGSKHPTITYQMDRLSGMCSFDELEQTDSKTCSATGYGTIEIAGVRRPLELEMSVIRKPTHYYVRAHTTLNWRDFGIEDPSILVAYVNPMVTVVVKVKIPIVS